MEMTQKVLFVVYSLPRWRRQGRQAEPRPIHNGHPRPRASGAPLSLLTSAMRLGLTDRHIKPGEILYFKP